MPYVGRDPRRGNYLKLDDIQSSFNGSDKTFNLTSGGTAYYPDSTLSVLVSVGGTVLEPATDYGITNNQITFTNAPQSSYNFFAIVQSLAVNIGVPGDAVVTGGKLSKPLWYDEYFKLDSNNDRVGIGIENPAEKLDVSGSIGITGSYKIATHPLVSYSSFILDGGNYAARLGSTGTSTIRHTQIYAGGNHQATFDGVNNRLGIGITNPQNLLDLHAANPTIGVKATGGNDAQIELVETGGPTIDFGEQGAAGFRISYDGGDNRLYIDSGSDTTVNTRVSIDRDTGKVGIGSAIPGEKLVVNGKIEARASGWFIARSGDNSGYAHIKNPETSGSQLAFNTSGEKMRITSTGKIGINTTSPTANLEIHGGEDNPGISLKRNTGGGDVASIAWHAQNASPSTVAKINYRGGAAPGGMQFYTGGGTSSELRMLINTAGLVGIGTNNPTRELTIFSPDSGSTYINLTNATTGNTTSDGFGIGLGGDEDAKLWNYENTHMMFATNATERVRVGSAGTVSIGDAATHTYDAHAEGDDLVIGGAGWRGMTIYGEGGGGVIQFADDASNRDGQIMYDHTNRQFMFRTAGNVSRVIIDNSGRLIIGHTSTDNRDGYESALQVSGTSGDDSSISIGRWSDNTSAPSFVFSKSRHETIGSHTVVEDGDILGLIQFQGDDGSNYHVGADIRAKVITGVGSDDIPTHLIFSTNGGTTSATERFRIQSNGFLVVNGASSNASSNACIVLSKADAGYAKLEFDVGTSQKAYVELDASEDLVHYGAANVNQVFYAGGTEGLRIRSDGNVGVGTINPLTKFVVSNDGAEGLEVHHASGVVEVNAYKRSDSSRSPFEITAQTFKLSTGNPTLAVGLCQNASGQVLIGNSTSIEPDGYTSSLQVHATDVSAGISILRYGNNSGGPTLLFGKSRGTTIGAIGEVADGDDLGKIEFYGTDTDWESSASIRACADGEWYSGSAGSEDNTDAPGRIEFHTTPNGADNLAERMRIHSGGTVEANSSFSNTYAATTNIKPHIRVRNKSGADNIYGGIELRADRSNGAAAMFSIACLNSSTNYSSTLVFQSRDIDGNFTEKMRIASGGDVGIGYDSPSCRLAVRDTAAHTTYANVTPSVGDCMMQLWNNPSSEAAGHHATIQFGIHGGTHNRVNTISAVSETSNSRHTATTFCTDDGSGRTEKLRITSTGRLGVGIAAPTKLLDIAASTSADGIRIKSTGNTYNELSFDANRDAANTHVGRIISYWNGNAVSYISFDTGSDTTNKNKGYMRFWTADGSGNFERLRIASNGKIHSQNAVQSGGNTTSGFQFDAVDSSCVLGVQGKSADNGGAATNAVFQGWFGSSNTFRVNCDGLIKTSAGVEFTATGDPTATNSTGGSETLDAYEEGTWTPLLKRLNGGTESSFYNQTNQNGHYTRIGNTVYIRGRVHWSGGSTGSGQTILCHIPYTAENTTSNQVPLTIGYREGWNYPRLSAYLDTANGNRFRIVYIDSTSPMSSFDLSPGAVATSGNIYFSGQYQIA